MASRRLGAEVVEECSLTSTRACHRRSPRSSCSRQRKRAREPESNCGDRTCWERLPLRSTASPARMCWRPLRNRFSPMCRRAPRAGPLRLPRRTDRSRRKTALQCNSSAHFVGAATEISDPLHAHLFVVAQSDRTLLCIDHAANDSTWLIRKCEGIAGKDRHPPSPWLAVHLDRLRRQRTNIAPGNSVNYFASIEDTVSGKSKVADQVPAALPPRGAVARTHPRRPYPASAHCKGRTPRTCNC